MTTYYEKNKEKLLAKEREKNNKKYEGLIEGFDYVMCQICGHKGAAIQTHITKFHKMKVDEYKQQFNVRVLKCEKSLEHFKEINPFNNHDGKFSPFSEKFVNADKTNRKELNKIATETRLKNNNDTTKIEYWLKKTNGNLEEAEKLLSERQSTFSLEKCIKKYGNEKGLEIWNKRQEKWLNCYNNKSTEEINDINRRKSNQMSFHTLWKNETNCDGIFYILDIGYNKLKIGITTNTVKSRYKNLEYNIVNTYNSTIIHCFQIEQLLKKYLKTYSILKENSIDGFGWTETFNIESKKIILDFCDKYFNDKNLTTKLFKEEFNLKYAENF